MESGQSYHIYNHANGMENIFREEENYRFFLQQYPKYLANVVDTYAYCLMPNHFHSLVGIKEIGRIAITFPKFETLEKFIPKRFSNFFSSYTRAFNKMYEQAYNQPEEESLLERDYYRNFFDGMDHVNMMMESKKELLMNKELD